MQEQQLFEYAVIRVMPRVEREEFINVGVVVYCARKKFLQAGPIGRLPVAERFRWLTATRSTVVQTSKVHPGFCEDPQQALLALEQQLVA